MGEDMHQRIYMKGKDGTYSNAYDFFDFDAEYGFMKPLVQGRCYDLYSLFGSRRGRYAELQGGQYGMPPFLEGTRFELYCRECGYYGFTWYTAEAFAESLARYKKSLERPTKYIAENQDDDFFSKYDSQSYERLRRLEKEGAKTGGDFDYIAEAYGTWFDENKVVIDFVNEALERMNRLCIRGENSFGDLSLEEKMFDLPQTVFLFFFDS